MAAITPTIVRDNIGANADGSVVRITWTPVTENDTCRAVSFPEFADKTIHVKGNFGGAAAVTVNGACDGVVDANGVLTYGFGLRNSAHSAISITALGGEAILENPEHIQPVVTGGTSVSLTICMTARLGNPLRN